MPRRAVATALAALALLSSASALQFEVAPGDVECVSDEIMKDELAVASFEVAALAGEHAAREVTMSVRGPDERQLYRKRAGKGRFAFTGTVAGHHTMCIVNPEARLASGAEAQDQASIAEQQNLTPAETSLREIYNLMEEINRETVAMRDAERVRRDLNERTNEYVLYFSVLSTVCVLAVAAWQTYHLRRFFHSKKLI